MVSQLSYSRHLDYFIWSLFGPLHWTSVQISLYQATVGISGGREMWVPPMLSIWWMLIQHASGLFPSFGEQEKPPVVLIVNWHPWDSSAVEANNCKRQLTSNCFHFYLFWRRGENSCEDAGGDAVSLESSIAQSLLWRQQGRPSSIPVLDV